MSVCRKWKIWNKFSTLRHIEPTKDGNDQRSTSTFFILHSFQFVLFFRFCYVCSSEHNIFASVRNFASILEHKYLHNTDVDQSVLRSVHNGTNIERLRYIGSVTSCKFEHISYHSWIVRRSWATRSERAPLLQFKLLCNTAYWPLRIKWKWTTTENFQLKTFALWVVFEHKEDRRHERKKNRRRMETVSTFPFFIYVLPNARTHFVQSTTPGRRTTKSRRPLICSIYLNS